MSLDKGERPPVGSLFRRCRLPCIGPAITIVTYFLRPKRARKKAQAAAIAGPIIVTAASRKREQKPRAEREVNPDVEVRVDAFFARIIVAATIDRRRCRGFGEDVHE